MQLHGFKNQQQKHTLKLNRLASMITKNLSIDCSSIIDINRLILASIDRLIFRSSVSSIVQVLDETRRAFENTKEM